MDPKFRILTSVIDEHESPFLNLETVVLEEKKKRKEKKFVRDQLGSFFSSLQATNHSFSLWTNFAVKSLLENKPSELESLRERKRETVGCG